MASFLPSYFQKRLLRYALSSVDFIDSDALDLDKLGLTLGQRSVIEVKDVPFRVGKLVEAVDLPPNLSVRTASIRSLRLTIPADLHASGIEVEVDGVDINAHLTSEPRDSPPPRQSEHANRPRLASPPVHDPGGGLAASTDRPSSSMLHRSRVLPTSDDLAASFLQSEPVQEREELEAALGSYSHMAASTASSTEADDTGLGMPAGFTLPAFVATFFQGIADRLTVRVRDVSVGVDMSLGPVPTEDSLRLILRIGTVDVEALAPASSGGDAAANSTSTRTVSLHNARVWLEATDDVWFQSSSPKLSRAASHLSASSTLDDAARVAGSESGHGRSSLSSDRDSLLDSATFEPTVGLGIDQSMEGSTRLAADKTDLASSHSDASSSASIDRYETDAESNANEASRLSHSAYSTPLASSVPGQQAGDLSESTLFSHEEAQSIYMSVHPDQSTHLSRSRAMPGGWDWSDGAVESEHSGETSEAARAGTDCPSQPLPSVDLAAEASLSRTPVPDQPPLRPLVQLLHLDSARVILPGRIDSQSPQLGSDQLSHGPDPLSQSRQPPLSPRARHPDQTVAPIRLDLGDLILDLDLHASKLLIRIVQAWAKALPASSDGDSVKPPASQSSSSTAIHLRVSKIAVNYRDNLRLSHGREATSYPDSPILSLSLASFHFTMESPFKKNLTVSKISVAHGAQPVLWFVDTVNVRDSIASSSMLRPHDVTVSISDRVEVQIKPVHIVVDLIRVDDVLSRSGGLSSLLDLGNSIMSTGTVTATSASKAASKQKSPNTRNVRFGAAPERHSRAKYDGSGPPPPQPGTKVNLRLSGTIIDLVGSEASIKVKSSAVKLALRSGSARIVVDGAAVEGPILSTSASSASPPPPGGGGGGGVVVFAKLKGVEVQYSEVPTEADLDRLITLITPSSEKFDQDDDIMVDTLLRQRRKGAVLDVGVKEVEVGARGLDWYRHFSRLSDELARLSTVAKYLPEDDRPGILIFMLIHRLDGRFHADDIFGPLSLRSDLIEAAYINVPSLAAAKMDKWSLRRSKDDVLVGEVLPQEMGSPMVMCRFIADEMEPTVRLKLTNCCVEYKVPTVVDVGALVDRLSQSYFSRAAAGAPSPRRLSPTTSSDLSDNSGLGRKTKIMVSFRHSGAALHPQASRARGLFLLTDALLTHEDQKDGPRITVELKKASLLVINDADVLGANKNVDHKLYFDQNNQIQELAKSGFVPVATISAALAVVEIRSAGLDQGQRQVDVEIKKNLLILETCADSTQTMIQILGSLAPPAPPSTMAKFRTEIVPIDDMLASFTGNAFVSEPGPEVGLRLSHRASQHGDDDEEENESSDYVKDVYSQVDDDDDDDDDDAMLGSESLHIAPVEVYAPDQDSMTHSTMAHSMLDFRSEHFNPKTTVGGTAHRWDSAKGTYGLGSETVFQKSPLKVRVRDTHVIWNMFDGYDWQSTRDVIAKAVEDIKSEAMRRPRSRERNSESEEEGEGAVIGDVLFNSIYISIPAVKNAGELNDAINRDIDDQASETSYASRTTATTVTSASHRRQSHRPQYGSQRRRRRLKLERSKQHKMSIELQGVSADVIAFPPNSGDEVESSIDVRVHKFEIFDHVPTSTWKKFATYMHDAGEREVDTSQVHIEWLNVRPVQDLSATEIVLKLTVLPLRLHVDQDALDFMSRFFEFKDDSAASAGSGAPSPPPAPPYLQRVEVNPIRVRLDYKPKTVDYVGLRSGRTTEFMNFIVLDRADMVLRRTILYGVSGFDRMGVMLNNIWMPDVKRNQLPGVLAGLAPVRPVVDVARGVNELIAVPIREYRKDGRLVRALQKGAIAFAKTTSTELANFGAKLAIGTQNVLQNAEDLLSPTAATATAAASTTTTSATQQDGDEEEEERKQISLYANQPVGIVQGLRSAYASLERDLLLARDAIVAVPGEVMAQPSATGAAKAILKQSPTIILRPAMGVSKATAQTLQGVANTLDRSNLRRLDDKYKRY